ncbi:hypothetical protein [Streptomyces sp. NPDC001530]|uniref:hypothetical protein n=1 Tax=Streptomyces sp. NPDC001530 TaxID=3364582 RepID=UPI0036A58D61
MADEQYRWLDRDAAERLLRGEPLEAVDADTRGQADRLAEALGALAVEPALSSAELPGEAAALAAFRTARTTRSDETAQLGRRGRAHPATHASDAGLVRLGRPAAGDRRTRWARPTRFGIAAALAAGMIGGVAVAAGTGVLSTPFSDERPGPAASVTAAATPDRPLVSPSPRVSGTGGTQAPTPDGTASGPSGKGSSRDEAAGGAAGGKPGSDGAGKSGHSSEWWSRTRSSCRDVLDGKGLDAGRRQVLEDAAGGSGRVRSYCSGLLDRLNGSSGGQNGNEGKGSGQGDQGSQGDQGDQGGDDDGHHILPGGNDHHGNGGILTPSPSYSALTPFAPARKPTSPSPSPTPTYSALSRLVGG